MRKPLALLFFMSAAPLAAQDLPKGQFPAGWKVRTDRANESPTEIVFVDMAPGWHLTTGPAAILYNPDTTASGNYRIESESFLFDPGTRNEAYGVFFGGRDLEGAGQAYTYFLIRRSGDYLVKRRAGAETPVVVDWTPHPAILKYDAKGEAASTAKNVLAVEVGPEAVRFLVNGQPVTTLQRSDVDTDGVVGLRLNHSLNLHVTTLKLQKR